MGGGAGEEPPSPCSGSRELQCVGKMEIQTPKPVGFLCGSIPVLPDYATNTALLPSSRLRVSAPRYRVLPASTDLNRPPVFPEKTLPPAALLSASFPGPPGISWGDGAISSNFSRRCEALAVSGLVEYGDEVDVIGPADMLKQIFKMPYSKARLSIVVHRIGRTLVLNSGPDLEEGEELIKRHGGQSKRADQSLFLNFAMHSVRVEACDCPPMNDSGWSKEQGASSVLPGSGASPIAGQHENCTANEQLRPSSDHPNIQEDGFLLRQQTGKRNKRQDAVKRASPVGEKTRSITQESERNRRLGNEGFMRVLFWQFHNFRMLLGSDLLLFSNEKHIAVSLHLWDVARQVTPLTWLEAWLDNIMASVPELAICYHQSGVVQGYELLKTEDIFLLKGISEDGSPAFNPHVVQQNGLSVLRFLQENCKQDPGAYWLYKGSGEEAIQLFDLSVMPKSHPDRCEDGSSPLPPPMHRGRSDSLFSLGTLLYRIGHRLSLSMTPKNRAKCASFIRKCLEVVDEPDQLVVRAFAHEQFARLMLTYDEDPAISSCQFPQETFVTDAEEESLDFIASTSNSVIYKSLPSEGTGLKCVVENESEEMSVEDTNQSGLGEITATLDGEKPCSGDEYTSSVNDDDSLAICESKMPAISAESVQTVADPISSKLAAIHHVSQAIKSLRWMRQLQNDDERMVHRLDTAPENVPSQNFSICACGDPDCIEVCDIRAWLPTSKLDNKLWKLVLLLGESYLALANAYKEEGQLFQALKVVQLACSVYGSMPQHLEDAQFISSMACRSTSLSKHKNRRQRGRLASNAVTDGILSSDDKLYEQFSSTYLFWSKAWTLVGDVYVELHVMKGKELSLHSAKRKSVSDLRMSSEVVKEVKRLKDKLGQFMQNCSACSLINCCCQSDRANSGSSASSSAGYAHADAYFRRHGKKPSSKGTSSLQMRDAEHESASDRDGKEKSDGGSSLKKNSVSVKEASQLNIARSPSSINCDKSSDPNANVVTTEISQTILSAGDVPKQQSGGIFQYIECVAEVDGIGYLLSSLNCYEQAKKALSGLPAGSVELQSISKKRGWVCNEIGRNMLEKKELTDAEVAFSDAITAFREVPDHTNIILIYCNLGHGRRALAEDMVAKLGHLRSYPAFNDAYNQALLTAKLEYCEAVKFYGAAKSELKNADEGVASNLENDVYTQYAHTYLRLGMLLAKEDVTTEVYESAAFEEMSMGHCENTALRKHEISANDALREALSVYESLGDSRKQEAAYAQFQLASYQRDHCFRFLKSIHDTSQLKSEQSMLQRVKQYASLAEKNWQKAIDFYGPETHPSMFLTVLIERSELSISLSRVLHANSMLEASLSHLLEGRKIPESASNALKADNPDVHSKFWSQLQTVLKKMLASALSAGQGKLPTSTVPRACDSGKLKELYRMSLKFSDLSQLHTMHSLWIS
ncbi:hypothetical protein MLD38_022638 [Melastoma candidum]|uniref:Uncharacterized protein n=1 Tax=Melastoma candidum TaxID=119954 RepID=A0ACB9QNB0_9MYRT|nr:hypothetical protein MLD38_022638 [Melastoma candidum]